MSTIFGVGPEVRQTFADDMFLRRHRGLGSPVVNQFVWRFDTALPLEAVDRFGAALARGSLGRRAVAATLPGARGRWHADPRLPEIAHRDQPLAADQIRTWIDRVAAIDLDPAAGPAWRLASAPLEADRPSGRGTLVSLVVAHAAADGGAMIDAIVRAASDDDPLTVPGPASGDAERAPLAERWVRRLRGVVPDARDAVAQGREVVDWVVARARQAREADASAPAPAARELPDGAAGWRSSWVVAELDAGAVQRAAARHGGTVNAWFVAVAAGLVRRTGRYGVDPVPVALPVSTREADDLRGNATKIARVRVTPEQVAHRRLGEIKEGCKDAYAAMALATEPLPLALVQMLPDALVRRLPPPPAAAALASNVGTLPEAFAVLGGVRADAVIAVAHQQGLEVTEAAASGGGLILFLVRTGDRLTLTVVACDPFAIGDGEVLNDLVTAELSTWQSGGDSLALRVW